MYRRIFVSYQIALTDVEGAFYAIGGETEAGAVETIEVVDVAVRGGTAKIEALLTGFAAQGIPIELDWYANRFWGGAVRAAQAKRSGAG